MDLAHEHSEKPGRVPALEVRELQIDFRAEGKNTTAVNGVSWALAPGETLAIVGESGCGKSVMSLATMRLLDAPPARYTKGQILLAKRDGRTVDVLQARGREIRDIRGRDIAMVFQEPMTSLNPLHTIGHQIQEAILTHDRVSSARAKEMVVEMLERVGIPNPGQRARNYPHELSGGMRQRVVIAIALSCRPSVLILDEPTTALDVTIQAQVLDLLRDLQQSTGTAMVFISHDLRVVREIADRVIVMYAGRILEEGRVEDIFAAPLHPYTRGLLASLPAHVSPDEPADRARLFAMPGNVPDLAQLPGGCTFHPRCASYKGGTCDQTEPELTSTGSGRKVRCARWQELN